MTLIGNLFRWIHGKLSNKPTNFSWVIENKHWQVAELL